MLEHLVESKKGKELKYTKYIEDWNISTGSIKYTKALV